jgi:hypothetical protein
MLCIEDWWPPYFIKKCGINPRGVAATSLLCRA